MLGRLGAWDLLRSPLFCSVVNKPLYFLKINRMSKSYVATHCTLTDFLMHIAHKKWQELVEDRITNLPGSRDVPSFWKLVVFVKYQADNEDNCVSFLSISECLNLFNSCVWVPQLSSAWKDISQNHTVCLLERVQICKSEDSAGHGGFIWRTAVILTVQNKLGTHGTQGTTTITKQKTAVDHPGNHSIKNQGFTNFWMGGFL